MYMNRSKNNNGSAKRKKKPSSSRQLWTPKTRNGQQGYIGFKIASFNSVLVVCRLRKLSEEEEARLPCANTT